MVYGLGLALGLGIAACEPTDELPEECGCFSAALDGIDYETSCEFASPCDTIEVQYDNDDETATPVVDNPAALNCALGVLGAGDAGSLFVEERHSLGERYVSVFADGEGLAHVFVRDIEDLEDCGEGMKLYELASTAYFDACAQRDAPEEAYLCLLGGLRVTELETCWDAYCRPYI